MAKVDHINRLHSVISKAHQRIYNNSQDCIALEKTQNTWYHTGMSPCYRASIDNIDMMNVICKSVELMKDKMCTDEDVIKMERKL